jgi:outer membrane receptor protein involved in Fe transport
MSLEDLLQVTMTTGSLTEASRLTTPVSITVITAQDIKLTPARNINDLIEIYVPGAWWMSHYEGGHIGMRGIIADRNYKFLMLVNGRLMNQRGHGGAYTEMENWDLNDIERIEILRGPGSVTYGPGAIMGVVNIVIKNARSFEGRAVHAHLLSAYNSAGAAAEGAFHGEHGDVYAYASITRTPGASVDSFRVDQNTYQSGFLGQVASSPLLSNPPAAFMADYNTDPQVKAHVEMHFLKELTLWSRYTNDSPADGIDQIRVQTGLQPDGTPQLGTPQNIVQTRARQFVVELNDDHVFSPKFDLVSKVGWTTQDFLRRGTSGFYSPFTFSATTAPPPTVQLQIEDINSLRFRLQSFSEQETYVQVLAHIKPLEIVDAAVGVEYSHDHFGPAWGDSEQNLRMGDNSNIISSPNSNAYGYPTLGGVDPTQAVFVGNGWDTDTISGLAEVNIKPTRWINLLLSGRADKNSYSELLLSPRVALVSPLNDRNVIKLIWQNAKRMNTAEQLLISEQAKTHAAPEIVSNVELNYTTLVRSDLQLTFDGYYGQGQIVAWSAPLKATIPLGYLRYWGAEAEVAYSKGPLKVGANQSVVKQISWKLGPGVTSSGISYASYNATLAPGIVQTGYGNDLNNWPDYATKLFGNYAVLSWVTLHLDAQAFWGMQGAQDGLTALENTTASTPVGGQVQQAVEAIHEQNGYGVDFNLDASVQAQLTESLSVTAYGANLAGTSRRYFYDAGNTTPAPFRFSWVDEPRTFGASLDIRW